MLKDLPKKMVLKSIDFYRKHLSHLKRMPSCRFIPTCSEYAYTAVLRYGVVKGGIMSVWRILRCNPFSRGGYDPVK